MATIESTSRAWFVVYNLILESEKETYTKNELLVMLNQVAIAESNFEVIKDIEAITGRKSVVQQIAERAIEGE